MKKFTETEKEDLVRGAQTAEASPLFDAFWQEVEQELVRMNEGALTVEPKARTING